MPTRLTAFPPDFGSDLDQVVPGRKNFAAKQFDYHLLSLGHRPPIFQPEQVPTTFVPRPRRTHPAPLCSVLLSDPPIEHFSASEHSLLRHRQGFYELPTNSLSLVTGPRLSILVLLGIGACFGL